MDPPQANNDGLRARMHQRHWSVSTCPMARSLKCAKSQWIDNFMSAPHVQLVVIRASAREASHHSPSLLGRPWLDTFVPYFNILLSMVECTNQLKHVVWRVSKIHHDYNHIILVLSDIHQNQLHSRRSLSDGKSMPENWNHKRSRDQAATEIDQVEAFGTFFLLEPNESNWNHDISQRQHH